ncbi:putative oxidoreductase,short chain dehydrogenase [Rhizodiscina lignyota]|uniref:3-dehydrosphinganine reductase n=1 Tax=Rhizodiscina lignyota TaxID=1504668 RepID=A0A9P4ID97_9PEZI|nr:putative oxidoreductase,short chain dehydrogenase [Rhizodiscina lignyota]
MLGFWNKHMNFNGMNVLITGGASGLGKELATLFVLRGASVTILARTKSKLESATSELQAKCKTQGQRIDYIAIDLTDHEAVEKALNERSCVPDIVICSAGGARHENGYFVDLTPKQVNDCMANNYVTAFSTSQICLRLWLKSKRPSHPRHIVFVSSTAAFVGVPGYAAYTASKVAVRVLADTLRQELLMYGGKDAFQVHCAFPGTFVSDALLDGLGDKPELTKQMEGLQDSAEVAKKFLSCEEVAKRILRGLENGEFMITVDLEGRALLNNMRGPSPRDYGFVDSVLGIVTPIIWSVYRRAFDRMAGEYGARS